MRKIRVTKPRLGSNEVKAPQLQPPRIGNRAAPTAIGIARRNSALHLANVGAGEPVVADHVIITDGQRHWLGGIALELTWEDDVVKCQLEE